MSTIAWVTCVPGLIQLVQEYIRNFNDMEDLNVWLLCESIYFSTFACSLAEDAST